MRWLKAWLRRSVGAGQPADPAPQADDQGAVVAARDRVRRLLASGTPTDAKRAAQEAAERFPDDVQMNVLWGNACLAADDAEGALDAFHLAAHYEPGSEGALDGRIAALARLGRSHEIPRAVDEFLAARPHHPGALHLLARMATDAGDFSRARELLELVLERHPDHPGALNDLGLLLAREFGDFARGEALLRRLLDADPNANHGRINLGWMLCEQGAYDEGFRVLGDAIARDPDHQEARLMRSLSRLKRGEFATGWDGYEARFASPTAQRRPFSFPTWDGAPLTDGRLLVYGEQGLGDQIMFASCLPDALARASDCVIECEPRLGALFARSFPGARVVTGPLREAEPEWLARSGPFQRQIALGSLPRLFRRRTADFPAHSGYLRADPARVRAWRERLAVHGPAPRIGISWRGGTLSSRRGLRSLDVAHLAPLVGRVPAVWVNLQYGDCGAEVTALARDARVTVHHWQEAIDDYDETAALVCALDLVVSVCTSLVHLTGAVGQRALVMVPFAAEWRYGAAGDSMPWYPSVRLIRQPAPGDWQAVFEVLRRELLTRSSSAA